jgi:hypothetical protein
MVGGDNPGESRFEAELVALDPEHHRSGPLAAGLWALEIPTRGGRFAVHYCHRVPCSRETVVCRESRCLRIASHRATAGVPVFPTPGVGTRERSFGAR